MIDYNLSISFLLVACLVCVNSFHFGINSGSLYLTKQKYYSTNPRRGPADNDFISNFFSKFLPTPEDLGLTRFDSNSRPENYPCTKTEWANNLPDDIASKDSNLILIRQLLAKTNLEFRSLKCVYDANKDGWRAKAFHEKVTQNSKRLLKS